VCKFSHRRTSVYVTCHLISHVLSRLPRFHTNVSPTRRVHAHIRTLQDGGEGRVPLSINFALQPTTDHNEQEEWMTTNEDWPPRLTTMSKKTDHEERLTTIDFHDDYHTSAIWRCSVFAPFVILCSISLRHFLTYESVFVYIFWHMRWSVSLSVKFPIVLADVNTLWGKFSVKRRVCMQILSHETMTVCVQFRTQFHSRLSNVTCLYKIVSTATHEDVHVFIKKAPLRIILIYEDVSMSNFQHTWTWRSRNFSLFWPQDRTMRRVHCKKNVPLGNFLTYENMYMCNKYHITPCLFQLASHWYTWILIPPRDFLTYKSFGEIDWQGGAPLPFLLPLSWGCR